MKTEIQKTEIKKLNKLAWLLDSSLKVPGTKLTIGVDGLIGLLPGIGDISGGLISSYIVLQAVKLGVSKVVIARMLVNVLFETTIGAVPLFGDIFDFIFKSNQRNVRLMNDYLESPSAIRRRSGYQVAFAILIGIAFVLFLIYLVIWIVSAIFTIF